MGLSDKIIEEIKKEKHLFFIIDTSQNISGSNIDTVNKIIKESIPEIKNFCSVYEEVICKIAILAFSSGVRWITEKGPVEVENFNWNNLSSKGIYSDFGAACDTLNEKLSTKEFMSEWTGFRPILCLFSNSQPTDNWKPGLDKLKQNCWYKHSDKLAIALSNEIDLNILAAFTGSRETVIHINNLEELNILNKYIYRGRESVRAESEAISESVGYDYEAKFLVQELKEIIILEFPKLEKGFVEILQTMIKEQGKDTVLEYKKCRAFLADYTKGEYKKESRLLLQAIDAKVSKAIEITKELNLCKKQQVRLLIEDHFMAEEHAKNIVDTLAYVLKYQEIDDNTWYA